MSAHVNVTDVLALYTAEALAVHKAFDKMGIPRTVGGEVQTMAQRAEFATRVFGLHYERPPTA